MPPCGDEILDYAPGGIFFSFFIAFIFSKGYEAKGLLAGVRFGLSVALLVALPTSVIDYAMMQLPSSFTVQGVPFSVFEFLIAEAILSGIFQLRTESLTTM